MMKKIILLILIILNILTIEASSNGSIKDFQSDVYLVSVHKCPGHIAGECRRVLGVVINKKFNFWTFRNAEYFVGENDTVILYYKYDILSFLLRTKYKGIYDFCKEDIYWPKHSQIIIKRKRKDIYLYSPVQDTVYSISFKIKPSKYNEIFPYKIHLKNKDDTLINVSCLFHSDSINLAKLHKKISEINPNSEDMIIE